MFDAHLLGELEREFLGAVQAFAEFVVVELGDLLFCQALFHHRWIPKALSHEAVIVLGDLDAHHLLQLRVE